MADLSGKPSPSNVKIYDRPERKGPSPIVAVIALLIVLVAGFFTYRAFHVSQPAAQEAAPAAVRTGMVLPWLPQSTAGNTGGAWTYAVGPTTASWLLG